MVLLIDIDLNRDPSCIHTMTVKSLEELKVMLYFIFCFCSEFKVIKVDSKFSPLTVFISQYSPLLQVCLH